MKRLFAYLFLVICLCFLSAFPSSQSPRNALEELKLQDLSHLWRMDQEIPLYGTQDSVEHWTPLGYIGEDYQRFEIRFISVIQDPDDRLLYRVFGKSRVKGNVCSFQGEIRMQSAYWKSPEESHLEGENSNVSAVGAAMGTYRFLEDPSEHHVGVFEGEWSTSLLQDKWGKALYDNWFWEADGFDNNYFYGTWTPYNSPRSKPCNWGHQRIPNSEALDGGACCFIPVEEFVANGWQNYMNAFWPDPDLDPEVSKAAMEEELKEWWKE